MKKLLVVLGAILFASTFIVGDLFAYTYSHSTSFTRTMARAATVSTPDSVYYNPVGLVKMKDGLYLEIGNQMGMKRYEHRLIWANYHDATPSFTIPNFALTYKNGKGAIFAAVYIPAGGGTVNYKKSTGILTASLSGLMPSGFPPPQKIKATNFWIQGAVGGAFSLTDWFAVTAGMKYSKFSYEVSMGYNGAGTAMKQKTEAAAFSGFGGIMISPMDKIHFTALYSSQVIGRGKTTDMKLHYSYIDEERLPDYLLFGLNVKPADAVEIQFSYQLNFSQQRNYGTTNIINLTTGNPLRDFVYGGYNGAGAALIGGNVQNWKGRLQHKVGLGIESRVHEMLLLSAGVSYESQEVYPAAQNPLDPDLKNIGVGLGGKLIINEQVSLEVGGARYFYFTDRTKFNLIKMNKSVTSFGAGLTAKIL
jgi:long-subunit fatty acid transport protein